ncbi:MAG: heme exporter protein CcmB [Alphaproteobacteria bacterium]|nr:heme exporter protein CcmB [Alphaproteobacteria bacterium]
MFRLIIARDARLAFRRGGGAFAGGGFCLMAFGLFAFGLGPDALRRHAAEALLLAVLLSLLLSLPGLFARDHEDGSLEQYALHPAALEWLLAAKLAAFWLTAALPLILLSPLLCLMAGLGGLELRHAVLMLLLATPALASIGMLGGALTLSAAREGLAQALAVLPLYVPVLIFATGMQWPLLAGLSLASVPLSCYVSAWLVRLALE